MRKILAIIALTITLGGCAGLNDVARTLTTTISNPISDVDIYRVKNTYAAALQLAVDYRTYCWSMPFAVLMTDPVARPICSNRRGVVRTFQSLQVKAHAAIAAADKFVANNPTINAASAVNAAWTAVTDFKNSIPARSP